MAEYPGEITFAQFASPPNPLLGGFAAGSNDRPAAGQKACPKTWGVEQLTLECAGKVSTSHAARDHAAIPAGRAAAGRFFFAPKADTVTIKLKLRLPENAETVKLELFRAGSGVPVWQRTLSAEEARRAAAGEAWDGEFTAGRWTAPAHFPHQLVTVEHSPYMLKATAVGDAEEGFVERWTYFDILVDKLELQWGGTARIPAATRNDVDLNFRADTVLSEYGIVAALATQTQGDAIDHTVRHEVRLPSNQFAREVTELGDDALFLRHKQQWGDGPRIPLVAKIWVLRANGEGVHGGEAARALGKAQFLWDWEAEDEITRLGALYDKPVVRAFLRDTLDYKRNDGTAPEGSTNCHVDHGGKRGGDPTVFPPQLAPFRAVRCATRTWATLSMAALAGVDAGFTGVTFQPSRMARDTYKVSVYLASVKAPGGAPELDTAASADDLRNDHTGLPSASTGVFEIQRLIRARYVRKAPAVDAADLVMSTTEYARAGLVLDWVPGPAHEQLFQHNYNAYVTRILTNALVGTRDGDSAALLRRDADCFAGIDQFTGGGLAGSEWAFTAHSWEVFHRRHKVDAIRRYVCDKPRKVNTPRSAYNRWRARHPHDDDAQWLLDFYDDLSNKRRAKIDNDLDNALADRSMRTREAYTNRLGTTALHGFKAAAGEFLAETADQGFICFHCCDSLRLRNDDGTLVEVPTTVGGLAPSGSCTPDGKKTMNLMFLHENVPHDRVGVPGLYDVPVSPIIKHEIGHNFYLPHAPSLPGKRSAGGFVVERHDAADLLCLMNYDTDSDHLCGFCNLRLRGWAVRAASGPGLVDLANVAATNKHP